MRRHALAPLWTVWALTGCGGRSELEIPPAGTCGNGVVEAAEACDRGADNEDRPAIVLTQNLLRRAVMPVDRAQGAAAFYQYSSESSHTGFEGLDRSVLLLFRDTVAESLHLVMHHGIDEDATGVILEHGLVEIDIDQLPPDLAVIVSDEPGELVLVSPDRAEGRFEFWRNSDGGVLGALPFPGSWSIRIRARLLDGITRWSYVDHDGEAIALDSDATAVLTAYDTPSSCRTDCTVPRCGDGVVDGGEVCDDGNTEAGDGCAADCASLTDAP